MIQHNVDTGHNSINMHLNVYNVHSYNMLYGNMIVKCKPRGGGTHVSGATGM